MSQAEVAHHAHSLSPAREEGRNIGKALWVRKEMQLVDTSIDLTPLCCLVLLCETGAHPEDRRGAHIWSACLCGCVRVVTYRRYGLEAQ